MRRYFVFVFARICAVAAALGSAGCTYFPTSGPSSFDVRSELPKEPDSLPYALVKMNPGVVAILAQYAPRLFNAFPDRRPPNTIRFGVGDVVSITIFEAATGGLFLPAQAGVRPGNFIALPNQAVDSNGNISIPYGGAIRARGRTPTEVQQAIVDALKNRAIDPQVIVTVVEQRTSLISVLGEVNAASRYPASAAGERILDAITRAGGPKSQGFDTWVMLERGGRRAIVPFGTLVYEPSNNIYVHPNDTVYLFREPQTFVAFGASGQQGQFNFDAWQVTLAEAVGKAGGLNETLADPASVFLYRGETRQVAEQLGIDTSKFEGPIIPVIYNVNFRDPAGYFLATKFQIRNKDVIYASNAASVETSKFLNHVRLIVGTINDPIVAANNAYALKSAIKGITPSITSVTVSGP
jgi:polysaccharide export outer membrane protein